MSCVRRRDKRHGATVSVILSARAASSTGDPPPEQPLRVGRHQSGAQAGPSAGMRVSRVLVPTVRRGRTITSVQAGPHPVLASGELYVGIYFRRRRYRPAMARRSSSVDGRTKIAVPSTDT